MDRKTEQRELQADIELLYTMYAEALDDGDIARWPGFFAEASPLYRITTRENLERGMELCFVLCDGQAMLRDRDCVAQDSDAPAPDPAPHHERRAFAVVRRAR
jgi:3-phenylpropionate/cinnamic acid dioxygenase small subunit